jgi:hypothetical protein
MDLKKVGCEGVDWTYLVQDMEQLWALVNMVNRPSDFIKGRES